jgi:hypothetical protein
MLDGLANLATQKTKKPSNVAFIRYLFFTMGICEKDFDECSIPYIMEMMKTHNYIKDEENKANKKAARK